MLCSCGTKKETDNSETPKEEVKEQETVTVDEGLLDVTITLPNSFFEQFETSAEEYVQSMDEGDTFKKVEINDDGSVSITMTRAKYNEFMKEMEKSVNDSLQEMINSGEYAFESVEHDNKFENFTVKLSTDEVGFAESFMVVAFAMYGGIYQLFGGNQNPHVVVKYIGSNGSELLTWDSSELNNQ